MTQAKKFIVATLSLAILVAFFVFYQSVSLECVFKRDVDCFRESDLIVPPRPSNKIKFGEFQTDLRIKEIETNIESQLSLGSNKKRFSENFDREDIVEEVGDIEASSDENWWVSSGAQLFFVDDFGKTIQGLLPASNSWRLKYSLSNPLDTNNGYQPQNLFRLVQKGEWLNYSQEVYFKINKINLSDSPNRMESNGLFLFNRYLDEDNLYYTGLRVDGFAVIKKKINGKYFTMKNKPYITGQKYDRRENPNLLPLDTWIGLRSVVKTNLQQEVSIELFVDMGKTGQWEQVLSVTDNGRDFGGRSIAKAGHAGIRTDFMDVDFREYLISE